MEFYDKLSELVEEFNGNNMDDEFAKRSLELLEEFLKKDDNSTEWLVHHFNSTAEYLCEMDYTDDKAYIDYLFEQAQKELDLFKKYGKSTYDIEYCLTVAKNDWGY